MCELATSATAAARLHLLFFNTGRCADLDVAVAEVVVSDTALEIQTIIFVFLERQKLNVFLIIVWHVGDGIVP